MFPIDAYVCTTHKHGSIPTACFKLLWPHPSEALSKFHSYQLEMRENIFTAAGWTDGQTQATTIPEGQYWLRVKRCDGRKGREKDRRIDWTIHRAAWSQLNIWPLKKHASTINLTRKIIEFQVKVCIWIYIYIHIYIYTLALFYTYCCSANHMGMDYVILIMEMNLIRICKLISKLYKSTLILENIKQKSHGPMFANWKQW